MSVTVSGGQTWAQEPEQVLTPGESLPLMYRAMPRASTRKLPVPGWLLIKTTGAPGVGVAVGAPAPLSEADAQPARNRARTNQPAPMRVDEMENIVLFINPPKSLFQGVKNYVFHTLKK
jgi:hypothetical protein